MRPVRLDMQGFAAFREPTAVDFSGADYFALVGPTGAGKSTVIDALTFALYGSVPRWDDRRTVALALAPTVNRGTVRLVFDANDARYVVARELRRAARTGGVTVRNARLEKLDDPDDADGDTEVLAADSGVTKAVEDLLGLSFEHFTTCVVLPQGDFAEFLHAKPADRQQILTRLLGLGVYERIGREANREATAHGERAALLAEQLGRYADATDEAVASAGARVSALVALADQVSAMVPELAAAGAAVTGADERLARLRADRAGLAALAVPPGLAALDRRRREAAERAEAARRRFAEAEAADSAARTLLADAPARSPLERARGDHAELARALVAHPVAQEARAVAQAAYERAAAAAVDATGAVATARTRRDAAAAALADARGALDRLVGERELLATLRVPPGLDAIARRRAQAATALAAATARLAEADRADAAVRDRLAAAPARGPLERAVRDHGALEDLLAAAAAVTARGADAVAVRIAAERAVTDARVHLEHARARREQAARADLAAALRPSLVAGEPCPVCAQGVAVLPPPLPGADLAALDAEHAGAQARLDAALRDGAAAAADERQAAAERERHDAEVRRLRVALADAPATAAEVAAQLAALDALAADAAGADRAAREARRARDEAVRERDDAQRTAGAAVAALRRARDPLVPLGAPEPDEDDPAADWARLGTWAAGEARARDAALPAARAVEAEAAATARDTDRAFAAAEEDAAARRRAETAAARAEQQARGRVEALDERIGQLRTALDGAPPPAQVAAELARLDVLQDLARSADAELREARTSRAEADGAVTAVGHELDASWAALRTARDPLVPLGAPPAVGDDLAGAWAALIGWAQREAALLDERLPAAERAVGEADRERAAVAQRLADALAAHQVAVPRGGSPDGAVATAVATARAVRDRLAERRADAARLLTDRSAAESAQQVAKMLGQLLRSDRFPRWLVASALDALVADASSSLAELSGGQFALTHDDGEFVVIDHTDADARRPVKTLSGGETFQASLALALALSSQMSSLAAEGAARLDSIFLDEGFGTLDEANLDTVASTLENLASKGDRMVGLITHVPALAERVPVRFAVRRDQRSSRIEREGA